MKALGHCVEIPGGCAARGREERWHDQAGRGDAEAQTWRLDVRAALEAGEK